MRLAMSSLIPPKTARRDLDRIFNTGGVAALVGNTYGAAKDVGLYVTGEVIRGLADLEARERERCANFASKAVATGLVERTVRITERLRSGSSSGARARVRSCTASSNGRSSPYATAISLISCRFSPESSAYGTVSYRLVTASA
jgi:hypothetical protein